MMEVKEQESSVCMLGWGGAGGRCWDRSEGGDQ